MGAPKMDRRFDIMQKHMDKRFFILQWTVSAGFIIIAAMLKDRALAAYLFGSFNTDKFSRHSDVDLFIITDTEVPFVERPLLFNDLLDAFPSLDILVYTPDEFRTLTSDPSPGFWSSAVSNMKRIV
ncbi:MAG: nucleotidyltransferase domain-containing protein [Spirochaetota bacterium]